MNTKKIAILGISMLLAACSGNKSGTGNSADNAGSGLSGKVVEVSNLAIGSLVSTPDTLVFADTNATSPTSDADLVLKNSSAAAVPLAISFPGGSNGFSIKVNRCPTSLPAGQSCGITASFSNRGLFTSTQNSILTINSVNLNVTANILGKADPSTSGTATLQASLSSAFSPIGTSAIRTLTITNTGTGTANGVIPSIPSDYKLWLNHCPTTLKPGASCYVDLYYNNFRAGTTPTSAVTIDISGSNAAVVSINPITNAVVGIIYPDIQAGQDKYCILQNARVFCKGTITSSLVGRGTGGVVATTFAEIKMTGVLAGLTIKKMSVGNPNVCVIASNDKLYCWGTGDYNGLGVSGSSGLYTEPVAVTGVLNTKVVTQVSVGNSTGCAIAGGQRYCWGFNNGGDLGTGDKISLVEPTLVATTGATTPLKSIYMSAQSGLSCTIDAVDNAFCWGNSGYLTGTNTPTGGIALLNPTQVNTPAIGGLFANKKVASVAGNGAISLFVATDGTLGVVGISFSPSHMLGVTSGNAQFLIPTAFQNSSLNDTFSKAITSNNIPALISSSGTLIYYWSASNGTASTSSFPYPIVSATVDNTQAGMAIDNKNNLYTYTANSAGVFVQTLAF